MDLSEDIVTLTATWVGKLKRRADDEVANALGVVARAHPGHTAAFESHFRGFCAADAEEAGRLWALALVPPLAPLAGAQGALTLRQMYWADNPGTEMLDTKGYAQVKHHIEYVSGYWKCCAPVGYARVDTHTGDISLLCLSKMRDVLMDVHYTTVNEVR